MVPSLLPPMSTFVPIGYDFALQPFVSVMVPTGSKQRPKIGAAKSGLGLGVAFRQIRVEEEEDSGALPVKWIDRRAIVFVR